MIDETLDITIVRHTREQFAMAKVGGTHPAAVEAAKRLLNSFADEIGLGAKRTAHMIAHSHVPAHELTHSEANGGHKSAITFDADAVQRIAQSMHGGR